MFYIASRLTYISLFLCFSVWFYTTNLFASDYSAVTQNEIRFVIADQLKAFEAKDVDRAYSHASATIKMIFKNSNIFSMMVKKSYPMIWAPQDYSFLKTSKHLDGAIQRMMFTDSSGQIHFFDYVLERFEQKWVISGVYPVAGEEGV